MKKDKDFALLWLAVLALIVIGALVALNLTGCEDEPDGCEHLDTRCRGQHAEICNADEIWELSMDCGNTENLVCCLGEAFGEEDWYCFLEEDCLNED